MGAKKATCGYESVRDAVFGLYLKGLNVRQIALTIGRSVSHVYEIRAALGLGPRSSELATLSPSEQLRIAAGASTRLTVQETINLARAAYAGLQRELRECESLLNQLALLASAAGQAPKVAPETHNGADPELGVQDDHR